MFGVQALDLNLDHLAKRLRCFDIDLFNRAVHPPTTILYDNSRPLSQAFQRGNHEQRVSLAVAKEQGGKPRRNNTIRRLSCEELRDFGLIQRMWDYFLA